MKKGKLLVVDDNEGILKSLRFTLGPEFSQIDTLRNPNLLPAALQREEYDVCLLDMNFNAGTISGNEGIFWLREILKSDADAAVIMITAYGDIDLAVRAMKEGAADFVVKPWDNEKLLSAIRAARKIRETRQKLHRDKSSDIPRIAESEPAGCTLVGESAIFKQLREQIGKVAGTDANVLLLGENGTGKELFAREIHLRSLRSRKQFISVDVGSLPATLIESELFGHLKGAFTDAREDRTGRFVLADGGTLFLDDIGNIPLSMQSKLLVVLQNRLVIPLGGNQPKPVNIRLISATNKPLMTMISSGEFREDLLYRINTIEITIPPLRDREEDILLLANHFMNEYSMQYEKKGIVLSQAACDKLMQYHWPGNVRELRHTMEKAVIMDESGTLRPEDFIFRLAEESEEDLFGSLNLESIEKQTILKALRLSSGNVSQAARELGITRKTLYSKIEKYGIS
ncbi:MAG: sigma-54 dependent transcriptional regulator [Bacteroidales bacterium]